MTFFVQRPGAACPWRSLQSMMRERHEATRAQVAETIRQRQAKDIPLDDRTDWRSEVADILDKARGTPERSEMADLIGKALGIAAGEIKPMPEYAADPEVESVEVRIRALSKGDVMDMRASMSAIPDGTTEAERWRSARARLDVIRPFLAKCLVGIRGVEVDEGLIDVDGLDEAHQDMPALLDVLDRAGLLHALFLVARDLMDLSPLARRGYGSPRPSTSGSSSAAPARHSDGSSLDATVVPSGLTSQATQTERPIGVPVVTSSITPGLETHSTSTA